MLSSIFESSTGKKQSAKTVVSPEQKVAATKQSDVDVDVWYPLRVYKVTVQYKLLSELGELSHFILNVMDSHALTFTQIEDVTGLSQMQLTPVIGRLRGLDLLNHDGITPKGKMLAYILRHVHDKELTLALDRHYHYTYKDIDMLLVPSSSSELKDIPLDALVIPEAKPFKHSKTEDCFAQEERFQQKLPELLPKVIPEFEALLPQLGARWGVEWSVTVRQVDKNKGICHSLPLKSYLNISGQDKTHLTLYTPALVLSTKFTFAEGFDWGDNLSPAEEISTVYSEIDDQIYNQNNAVTISDPDFSLQGEPESLYQDVAQEMIKTSITQLNDEHELFSRNHSFTNAWQQHQYTYQELMDNLTHPDVIRG
ncbi:hypothetical protein [Thalassotalea sp. ND16A]|uniref:hypothetical protein n=1 Tax=Thalassotalea sp. ND16A TaxID=1535422 RepID=UPI00051A0ADB|nr:hypothetical protein [Thalassotalea sp. ND16A]KGJ91607.1 hypothetical protein ND16A_1798 [Thalassotalea sp. ND16A]